MPKLLIPAPLLPIFLLVFLFPMSYSLGAWSSNANSLSPDSHNISPELVLQTGHSIRVNAVALSPDNRLIASGSADNTIRLWDVNSGNELRVLQGHTNWVKCVSFSNDGKFVASGSIDRTVRIWDVETGRQIQLLVGQSAPVEALAFSADGHQLASGSADSTAMIWDVASGREVATLRGHTDWITSIAFDNNAKQLATGSRDQTVRLWDLATRREALVLKGHTDRIKALAFSPDGQTLASGGADRSIKLWKTVDGKELRTLTAAHSLLALAFSQDGRQLFSATDNKSIKVWDVKTGREVRASGEPGSLDVVESIAFGSDFESFVASADKAVELYKTSTGQPIRKFDSHLAGFYAVAFSPNGHWLASGSKDKTVRLWDLTIGREMPALVGHSGYVTAIAFSRDGQWLASASVDKTIRIWDLNSGQEIKKLTGHEGGVDAIAFSPDSKLLASASYDRTVRVWDFNNAREVRRLTGHVGEITTVAFSPDGRWLASASVDKSVRMWDTATWGEPRAISESSPVSVIAFSHDSKLLAIATTDKQIKILDATSGVELRVLQDEAREIRALTFSPDNHWLVSGDSDETAVMWDVATWSRSKQLRGHSGAVDAVDFSADGKWLVSGSEDGSIVVWDSGTAKKAATIVSLRESNDWVVLTPDGLFDGSPDSWNQILWRFAGNTFNFAPVEQFFNEFFYPGLLADILSGKKPQAPQDIALKDRRQPRISVGLGTLANENTITARNVTIKISLSEARSDTNHAQGSGVRDVRLFRNGSLVKVWHGDIPLDSNGAAELQTNVSLVAGRNSLTAYSFNRDNIKSEDVTLTLMGDEKLRRRGTAYILAVGVNQYANAEFNLRYAVPDADDFAGQLQHAQAQLGNFEKIEVIPLFDNLSTKSNIMLLLRRLADNSEPLAANAPAGLEKIRTAQPEDTVVIYFAGHGKATSDGRFYLIPHDLGYDGARTKLDPTGLQSILEHSISDRELEDSLEKIDAGQFLLVIDACNSGQALEGEEKRRGPMNSKGLAQLAYEKGMHVLTASQNYQVALERRSLSHGYLTYALVEEGLRTRAADTSPKDGQVTLQEWLDYAVARVPLLQTGVAKDEQGRLLEQDDEVKKKKDRDVQRPRVFYRWDTDAKPLIVARPGLGDRAAQ